MTKQTKIIISILIVLAIIIGITFGVVMYYKTHPVENPNIITENLLISFKERNSSGEKILTTELKDYDVISTEESNNLTTTYYVYNDKYDLEVKSINKVVISMYIVNRLTYTRCNILEEDIREFTIYD